MTAALVYAGTAFAALSASGVVTVALFADALTDDWQGRIARGTMWSIVLSLLCEALAIFTMLPR